MGRKRDVPAPRGDQPMPWLGVYHKGRPQQGRGEAGSVISTDRRMRRSWRVPAGRAGGAEDGEIVLAEALSQRGPGPDSVRITDRLGRFDGVAAMNLIAIRTLALPEAFPAEALAEAAEAGPVTLAEREDLRSLPLVTIDGEDARDFDDAVFAEPREDGFRIIVAIADVAHYVRAGSALDQAAAERGNSVYLPGRVLPMLPPALSERWCSLVPDEERGVLFAEIFIDANGRKCRHRFARGVMRSRARLTYAAVQQVADAGQDAGLPGGTLGHLFAAWRAFAVARKARGALEIDLPERRVLLDAGGGVAAVEAEPRLDSHRLIEEFMIAANVAAAEELLERCPGAFFRVHPAPPVEKLVGLKALLAELGAHVPARRLTADDLAATLAPLAGTPEAEVAADRLLQALPQALYDATNTGHFGLALSGYAHFTSPIRRYADLLTHRALIGGLGLGTGGVREAVIDGHDLLAQHLGMTERRAAEAERSVLARAQAQLLANKIGNWFDGRISGVTKSALFVTVTGSGANGIVPLATLERDLWRYDELSGSIEGARTGLRFFIGQAVRVRLAEADPVSGRLAFRIGSGAGAAAPRRSAGGRSRPRC